MNEVFLRSDKGEYLPGETVCGYDCLCVSHCLAPPLSLPLPFSVSVSVAFVSSSPVNGHGSSICP